MKPRKVMIHLEVLTDIPLKYLRDKEFLHLPMNDQASRFWEVHQVIVQVVKEDK